MNFTEFMQCCSANYARLYRLIPQDSQEGDTWSWSHEFPLRYLVQLVEKQRYTHTFYVRSEPHQPVHWLSPFKIEIKMYHDAQLVEVVKCHDYQGKTFPFPYWEKWRMNELLSDILKHCLQCKLKGEQSS